jgi:hypothetical protein
MRRFLLCWLALAAAVVAFPAWAIDGLTPTLASPADVAARRTTLITQVWGTSTLPTTLPVVTNNICPAGNNATPCAPAYNAPPNWSAALTNVAQVDQYVANMSNGQTNTGWLYTASPANGRVVIFNGGHQGFCDPTLYVGHYNMQQTLQLMLANGYSVFMQNMPGCNATGDVLSQVTVHMNLFTNYGNAGMRYFMEPAIQAMNYWDAHQSFSEYEQVGLSGGAWTATLLPAVDTRIAISVPVAGSWPGMIFNPAFSAYCPPSSVNLCGDNCTALNCAEQNWVNFYTAAGFVDLYVMNSFRPAGRRRQLQILNYADDAGFGNTQFTTAGANTTYGLTYPAYIASYTATIHNLQTTGAIAPMAFDSWVDMPPPGNPNGATRHQISVAAQAQILAALAWSGARLSGRR